MVLVLKQNKLYFLCLFDEMHQLEMEFINVVNMADESKRVCSRSAASISSRLRNECN